MGDETDDEWLEPDDQMGVADYQVHPLTVLELTERLSNQPHGFVFRDEFYDGSEVRALRPCTSS